MAFVLAPCFHGRGCERMVMVYTCWRAWLWSTLRVNARVSECMRMFETGRIVLLFS